VRWGRWLWRETRADAALAASIFHFNEYTIAETKRCLQQQGVSVRPSEEARGSEQPR